MLGKESLHGYNLPKGDPVQRQRDILVMAWIAVKQGASLPGLLEVGCAVFAVAVLLLGWMVSPNYFWGLLILPLPVLIALWGYQQRRRERLLCELRSGWGKETIRERHPSDIEGLFRYAALQGQEACVDDQTWHDLNMDDLYTRMDRTLTSPGQCVLYKVLRTPLLSDESLKKRKAGITLFEGNPSIREGIQVDLARLGRQKGSGITTLLWDQPPASTPLQNLYTFLAFLALIALVFGPWILGWPAILLVILPVYLINMLAASRVRTQLLFQLATIRYLGAMIRTADRIASQGYPDLEETCQRLRQAVSATRQIARKTTLLLPENSVSSDLAAIVYSHLDTYFLREVRIFYAVLDEIRAHQEDLKTLYLLMGELDALQSIASFRQGLGPMAEPRFVADGPLLEVRDLRHPLLENPVANSVSLHRKGVSITGSNMAGKTTFLRTLGVNAILAQTIDSVLASSYTARYFRLFSLLNEQDSLMEGKSYYLAEAEHLLRMIRASDSDPFALCLIDEPLAGTNSIERTAASLEILRYLANHNAMVIVATHDLHLAHRLLPGFDSYHFTDNVDEQGLCFDYLLKPGISSTSNAIRLLEVLDYPKEITDRARQAAGEG